MFQLDNVQWIRKYRAAGAEFFSVYRNGQIAISAALIRRMGGDPTLSTFFRAGKTPSGDLMIQLIPQAEHNVENGDTWKITPNSGTASFNVRTLLGWEPGKRYKYLVDPTQKAILVDHTSAYDYHPSR